MYTGNYEDEENMSPVYPTRAADLSVADLVAESKTKTVFMDMEFAESDDEDDEDFSGSNSDCSDDDDSEASNTIEGEDSDEEDDDDEDQDMEDDENDEDVTGFMTICGFESEDEAELQANEEAEADDHVYILKANQEKDIEPADYKTKVPHAMFTSVGVFLMALRLGVPPLQVLAHERFYRSMEKMLLPGVLVANPLPGDIPAVIDRVYSTPELVSTILADSCATFIQANYENDDLRAGIEPILAKHSGLAVKVLHRYMDYTKSKYWRLRDGPGCD
ncbi:hypothetical protein B0T17DRAFT_124993 [Bombardia bombarda]|uniref:Uncharacterized protein n=1 Tax=Bombardia bombarda TaxID=252184 RepID=A0AA39TJY8_9PEZI|nr:hypothetical protein B0T17DRAFT_124993 [Bombardia bombarda]